MRILIIGLFTAFCVACGGSGGGSGTAPKNYKPLGKAQKERLKKVSASLGEVLNFSNSYVPQQKSSNSGPMSANSLVLSALKIADLYSEKLVADNNLTDEKQTLEKMKNGLNKDNCQMKLPEEIDYIGGEGGDMNPSIPLFVISIDGKNCPIALKMTMTGAKEGAAAERFSAVFTWSYEAFSDEFKAHTDVDKIEMSGKIIGGSTNPGAAQPGGQIGMDMVMSLKGFGHSQTQGDFTTESTADMKMAFKIPDFGNGQIGSINIKNIDFGLDMSGHMNKKDSVTFDGVDALLESLTAIKGLMNFEEKHFINKEAVSKEVYEEYAGDLKYPGQDDDFGSVTPGPIDGITNPGVRVVQCWTTFYDSQKVTLEEVQKAIRDHNEPNIPAIAGFNSCGPTDQFTLFEGKPLTTRFSHNIDSLRATIQYDSLAPIDFFGLEGEDLDVAKAYGNIIVRFACEKDLNCQ